MIALPSWSDCALAIEENRSVALHRLIYLHEADGKEDAKWRVELMRVLEQVQQSQDQPEHAIEFVQLRETAAYLARSGHHQAAALLAAEAGKLELAAEVEKKDAEIAELRQQLKVHE